VRTLPIDEPIQFVTEAVRVAETATLVVAGNASSATVYYLTDYHAHAVYTRAVSVDPAGDPRLLPDLSVWDTDLPRVLFQAFGATLLYNTQTLDLLVLDLTNVQAAQLTPEGVRYGLPSEHPDPGGVYDYHLNTGETTPRYSFTPTEVEDQLSCRPYGRVWVCERASTDEPLMITRVLVYPDGSTETLPDGNRIRVGFDGETYRVSFSQSEDVQHNTLISLVGDTPTVFTPPPEINLTAADLLWQSEIIDAAHLLIVHDSGFTLVAADGSTTRLGNYFCCGSFDAVRPPWYALFLEGETVLWNVRTREIVMRTAYSIMPGRSGFYDGAFFAGNTAGEFTAYSFEDAGVIVPPARERPLYQLRRYCPHLRMES
jgi:hypothetical protein